MKQNSNFFQDSEIKLVDLCQSFGHQDIFKDINIEINKGDVTCIIGGSGVGKSVLVKIMSGLIVPSSGKVLHRNIDINSSNINFSSREKILTRCGFLFQGGALFDSLNVYENIVFFAKHLFGLKDQEQKDFAALKLQDVGLDNDIIYNYPIELSGGMQKRVALARTIATNPKVIFFDEPTTGLDPIMSNVINDLIINIKNKLKATIIVITHDMNTVKSVADQVGFLSDHGLHYFKNKEDIYKESNKENNPLLYKFIRGEID
ncbi:MAG TPA: ATP-binding cassette domain-containing protein [Candidatus Megaira endosymbiont of Hartmannula sinica]|nr:ATP-binding cassette domain-containing protein [Candidatus Megaera endosymbiont of Hartmannula sinica]